MSNDGFCTLKIRIESRNKLRALMDRIARVGWVDVGVNSAAPVTIWNTVDAALDALSKQKKEKK